MKTKETNRSKRRKLAAVCGMGLICLLAFLAGIWSSADTFVDHALPQGPLPHPSPEKSNPVPESKAIRELARKTPEHALIRASQEDLEISPLGMLAITSKWLEEDPDAPLRFLLESASLSAPNREQLFIALLPTIVSETPEKGLELAEGLSQPQRRMQDLVEAWALIDPENALHYLWNIQQRQLREDLSLRAYGSWFEKDSEQALGWLLAADDQSMRRHLLSFIKRHPLDTNTLIRLFRESDLQKQLASTLAERLGREHVVELIELLNTAPWSGHLRNAYSGIKIKNRETFEAALDALHPGRKDRVRKTLLRKWGGKNQEDGWAWIQEQEGSDYYPELLRLYSKWFPNTIENQSLSESEALELNKERRQRELLSKINGMNSVIRNYPKNQLVERLHKLPEGEIKDGIIKRNAARLMVRAPMETLGLIRSQAPSTLRREQSQKALEEWIWTDPAAARAYIDNADWIDQKLNAKLRLRLAQQLSSTDPSAAIRLLTDLPQTDDRNHPLGEFLEDLAIRGQAQLVRNTIDRLPQGAVRDQALLKVLDEFADQDPEAAYDWIKYEQDEAFQSQAFNTLSRIWVKSDSQAAGQWVRTLPPGKGRDQAIRTMVTHESAQEAHKSAFDWALTIRDDAARKSELGRALNNWAKKDADDARRAVNYSSQLSESEKETLLERIK